VVIFILTVYYLFQKQVPILKNSSKLSNKVLQNLKERYVLFVAHWKCTCIDCFLFFLNFLRISIRTIIVSACFIHLVLVVELSPHTPGNSNSRASFKVWTGDEDGKSKAKIAKKLN